MTDSLPRFVIAAPASGHGKTTLSVGIMAALRARGLDVAPFKVGPDYIDPGYHSLATGRPGRNLDPWLQSDELIVPLLKHGSARPTTADVSVIEGVMGLYDGRLGTDGFASTAHIAKATHSPVVIVADVSCASRTIAASLTGLRHFDEDVHIAGVILNKAGSPRHFTEVARACERAGLPVLGGLSRDADVSVPSRHLGLVPAAERDSAQATLDYLAAQVAEHIDLDALLDLARSASPLAGEAWVPPQREGTTRARVAIAGGRAFTFQYAETTEIMRAQGLEPEVFDPIRDRHLPHGISGIYLGGGFPEVHAKALSGNTSLLADLREAVMSGTPTVAECAGLLYLLDEVDGRAFAGLLPATAAMTPRLTLGYRTATAPAESLLASAGDVVRGHEFHRTKTSASGSPAAWDLGGHLDGFALAPAGLPTVHASYLHTHWAGFPQMAIRFADAVHAATPFSGHESNHEPSASANPLTRPLPVRDPLRHHGDVEADADMVNFAVNVRGETPGWLKQTITAEVGNLAAYPSADAATSAVAQAHAVSPHNVTLTNGAAEAFTLIARAIASDNVTIVHPQFTEPDAAMQAAGRTVTPVVLDVHDEAPLTPARFPSEPSLIVIGNPTNPTGRLHSRDSILKLRDAGHTVVVDEAFMDAVPGEPETLLVPGADLTRILVVRSLTKTWALAGLRAGYVIGDPELVSLLRAQQPHWSVNSLALATTIACLTPAARKQAREMAEEGVLWRQHLTAGLRELGYAPIESTAPFVLVQLGEGKHQALRDRGFATRRADTFPGLDHTWVRLAIRDPLTTDTLLRTLKELT